MIIQFDLIESQDMIAEEIEATIWIPRKKNEMKKRRCIAFFELVGLRGVMDLRLHQTTHSKGACVRVKKKSGYRQMANDDMTR